MCVLVDMTHEGGGGSFDTYARAHVNVYAGANILHDRQLLRGEETVHILCCLSWHVYPGIFPPPVLLRIFIAGGVSCGSVTRVYTLTSFVAMIFPMQTTQIFWACAALLMMAVHGDNNCEDPLQFLKNCKFSEKSSIINTMKIAATDTVVEITDSPRGVIVGSGCHVKFYAQTNSHFKENTEKVGTGGDPTDLGQEVTGPDHRCFSSNFEPLAMEIIRDSDPESVSGRVGFYGQKFADVVAQQRKLTAEHEKKDALFDEEYADIGPPSESGPSGGVQQALKESASLMNSLDKLHKKLSISRNAGLHNVNVRADLLDGASTLSGPEGGAGNARLLRGNM